MARASTGERPLVAGVGISHPDRLIYPDLGITKLQLARYYEAIGDPSADESRAATIRCTFVLEGALRGAIGLTPRCAHASHPGEVIGRRRFPRQPSLSPGWVSRETPD